MKFSYNKTKNSILIFDTIDNSNDVENIKSVNLNSNIKFINNATGGKTLVSSDNESEIIYDFRKYSDYRGFNKFLVNKVAHKKCKYSQIGWLLLGLLFISILLGNINKTNNNNTSEDKIISKNSMNVNKVENNKSGLNTFINGNEMNNLNPTNVVLPEEEFMKKIDDALNENGNNLVGDSFLNSISNSLETRDKVTNEIQKNVNSKKQEIENLKNNIPPAPKTDEEFKKDLDSILN